jgi:ABC-type sugar transport system ATPase subunit
MVGRDISETHYNKRRFSHRPGVVERKKVLSVENLTMGTVVKNMSFTAYAGEVLCLYGLVGSGRTEVARIIYGAQKRNLLYGGRVYLFDRPIRYRQPSQAIEDGIVYITEDRKTEGIFETMKIDNNIYIGYLTSPKGRRLILSKHERDDIVKKWVDRLSIRALSQDAKVNELSGGNQQKVVVAKSLVQEPGVIIFDEPTRGIDVASVPEIHKAIRELANEGKAVIVITSYLPEALSISDRILVTQIGHIAAEFSPEEATEEKIMYAAIH